MRRALLIAIALLSLAAPAASADSWDGTMQAWNTVAEEVQTWPDTMHGVVLWGEGVGFGAWDWGWERSLEGVGNVQEQAPGLPL